MKGWKYLRNGGKIKNLELMRTLMMILQRILHFIMK